MLLGNTLEQKIVLTDQLEALAEKQVDLKITTQNFSLENNIDYLIAENDAKSKELLLKLEKSKALPSVSAFINGAYTGNSNSFTFLNREQDWFGSSLFGVNLKIPLFSSGKRAAATKRAAINLEISKNELSDVSKKIKLELAREKTNYEFAIDNLYSTKNNLKLATRIERKNQLKFKEGIASSFELREAQIQLYSAQQEYLQAMTELINSKATYESILNSNSIQN
jgi:outer membrane protein TolC